MNKEKSRNDKKENKEAIDKGPHKDDHTNQYRSKDSKTGLAARANK